MYMIHVYLPSRYISDFVEVHYATLIKLPAEYQVLWFNVRLLGGWFGGFGFSVCLWAVTKREQVNIDAVVDGITIGNGIGIGCGCGNWLGIGNL